MASKIAISASDDNKKKKSSLSCNFCMYLLPNRLKILIHLKVKKSIQIDMFVTLLVLRLLEFHHGVQNGL